VLGLVLGLAQPAAAIQLITNGGFETGDFTGWHTAENNVGGFGGFFVDSNPVFTPVTSQGTVGPSSGTFYAVTDANGPGAHALWRPFTVPALARFAILDFDLFVNDQSGTPANGPGLDPTTPPNQYARVDILRAGADPFATGADVLQNLFLGVNPFTTNPNPYTHYTFNLIPMVRGRGTVVLRFAEVDTENTLNLGVDNVSIRAPAPGTFGLLAAGLGMLLIRRLGRQRRPAPR
jgi:hypothetical protein